MRTIHSFLLFSFTIKFAIADNQIFLDQASGRKSRSQLMEEYERCRRRHHSDLPSDNNIANFDVTSLQHRGSFASIDSGEAKKPRSKVIQWPRGEVPVQLEPGFTKQEQSNLKCAILYFRAHTCLTFLTKNDTHVDYIYLMKTHKKGGCFTDVIGKQGGKQIINLDPASDHCWEHGTIIHELMHVLGFFHEHSRSDRDKFLKIHWNNIPKSLYFQYWTTADMGYEHKDVGKYDFGSVMHYSRYFGFDLALSAKVHDDQYEQQAKENDDMGQRIAPSDEDTNKLNLMYCPHLVVQSIPSCKDELDCAGFVSLCQTSQLVQMKCRNTCNLCIKDDTSVIPTSSTLHTTEKSTTVNVLDGSAVRSDFRCGPPYGNSGCPSGQCCNYVNYCDHNDELCYPSSGGTLDSRVRSDFRCGDQFNDAPCDPLQCCNSAGWCDYNSTHCFKSNGTTPASKVRGDFRCGHQFNDAPCDPLQCCNFEGWCDSNRTRCFHSNGGTLDSKVRNDFRCGHQFNDAPCDPLQCCNFEGWCDTNRTRCFHSNGGTLDSKVRNDFRCGHQFNDAPCDPLQCCNFDGWCDTNHTHCYSAKDGTLASQVRSDYRCGHQFDDALCNPLQCCNSEGWCSTNKNDCQTAQYRQSPVSVKEGENRR